MKVDVQFAADPDLPASWFRAIAGDVIAGEALRRSGELSVILLDDAAIRRINARFSGE